MDAERSRQKLADLLRERGIRDERVLEAMEQTPRELFVPKEARARAFDDSALPIGESQTISQPYIVARMTELARLNGDEQVLEIGTGSGYQAAVLARLAEFVVTVERHESLHHTAHSVLHELRINNVEFHFGDGTLGWPEQAPYDAILVTAAAPEIPKPLYDQLTPGGRMVIPVGTERDQVLEVVEKSPGGPVVTRDCFCRFVPLIGAAGWPEG